MAFDYNKLKGRIVEVYGTQGNFAKAMGLSERTVSLKMNGTIPFRQTEIVLAIKVLGLTMNDIQTYFFNVNEV